MLAVLNLGLLAIPAERAQQQLRASALTDPPTGVWNRAGFEQQSEPLIEPGATVLAIDIDRFKQTSDQHGHYVGDEVHCALAGLAGDEVSSLGGVFGRRGGDEYIAVLPAARSSFAQACAHQIHDACRQRAADMPDWTISVGFAQVEEGEADVHGAMRRAGSAVYRSKDSGRDKLTSGSN